MIKRAVHMSGEAKAAVIEYVRYGSSVASLRKGHRPDLPEPSTISLWCLEDASFAMDLARAKIDARKEFGPRKTRMQGERHPRVKLSDQDVAEIRRRLAAGDSFGRTAKAFGVSKSCVQHIGSGLRRPESLQPQPRDRV